MTDKIVFVSGRITIEQRRGKELRAIVDRLMQDAPNGRINIPLTSRPMEIYRFKVSYYIVNSGTKKEKRIPIVSKSHDGEAPVQLTKALLSTRNMIVNYY